MDLAADKCLGMLWGLHVGDCLGAPLEFLPASTHPRLHTEITGGGKFNWRPGEATDDTDLMLCLLRSIVSPRSISFEILKREMLSWLQSEPPDIGTTTIQGLRNLQAGLPLQNCGVIDEKFQGNGSLMRVAPLSLLSTDAVGYYGEQVTPGLEAITRLQTRITHGHQNCIDCDEVFVAILRSTLSGASRDDIFEVAMQSAQSISLPLFERIKKIPQIEWNELSTSGFCVDTLCAGLWAFLKYESFEDSVIAVVNRGDDSDSCGAVAGALCGAFYGASSIPERWLRDLEYREEIECLLKQKGFLP